MRYPPRMASKSRLCIVCGFIGESDEDRRDHMAREHPGTSISWRDRHPWIVEPNGTETRVGTSALRRMRAAAKAAGGTSGVTQNRRRRRAAPAAAPPVDDRPMVEHDEPDGIPYFTQDLPPFVDPTGAPAGPSVVDEPDEDEPTDAELPEQTEAAKLETVRLALDQKMVAEVIRNLSQVISEWDGAGPAGVFSHTEAAQLAMLLHEPTVVMVARYMDGNVNRFLLGMAAVVILLGKGRVHAKAIVAKRREAQAEEAIDELEAASFAATPDEPQVVVSNNGHHDVDPIAELAQRQREWNTTPHHEGDA